jgi:hypothetical protein
MNPGLNSYPLAKMAQNMLSNYISNSMSDEEAMKILLEVKKILDKYSIK